MPNVHMQQAATNLQQAVSDLNLFEQQVRADTDNLKREFEQRLNQIKVEKSGLVAFATKAQDEVTRQQYQQTNQRLDEEQREIEGRMNEVQQQMERQISDIDQQRAEVKQMADQLARMA